MPETVIPPGIVQALAQRICDATEIAQGEFTWQDFEEEAQDIARAALEAITACGLIVVRRDDLDAYVNRTESVENVLREVDALDRLRDVLDDKEKPHV